jgi:hypothetical protein
MDKPSSDPLLQNSRLLIDPIRPQFQEYAPNNLTKLFERQKNTISGATIYR